MKQESAREVALKINGTEVRAREGMTVLDAARSAGIEIPTLCHREELSPYGACRLCVVELVRGNRSRIVVSCLYPVENGLEVLTESQKVAKHRKVLLELLQARWPWIDKELLERYGAEPSRFDENPNFCVLCGLCVRHCSEVKKANVLGFLGRGTDRQVVIYPELAAKHCPTCGDGEMECLSVCPTGVISSEFAVSVPGILPKLPLAYPVCVRDDDNIRHVRDSVGDREPGKNRR